LHSQDALELISVGSEIPQEVADIRELCFRAKVSAEEAQQLTEKLCALGANLIRTETNKGLDGVTFATMLTTKPGIKELWAAVDASA
jgi:hypothetical protein